MSGFAHALFYTILVGAGVISGMFSLPADGNTTGDEFCELEIIESAVETPEVEEISEMVLESVYKTSESCVTVLRTHDNTVEKMDLEEYVEGVMLAEMPSWYGDEALKAAAVAVRTYTVYKMNSSSHSQNAKLCDNPSHCQAFYKTEDAVAAWSEASANKAVDRIKSAVKATEGKILIYENEPILAMYHASSYLKTRSSAEVFGGDRAYLQSVSVPFEDRENARFSEKVFEEKYVEKILLDETDFKSLDSFSAVWENKKCLGVAVKSGDDTKIISASRVRTLFSLASGNFEIEKKYGETVFKVYGFGHGVGLSQQGAGILAERGWKWEEIVLHYYKNAVISNLKFCE